MAEVWQAHDEALDVDVAIKFIRGDLEHPELADRLLQEARAAARLGHPAIVRVHDYGKTQSGDPYIAMELLEGETLASIIEQRGRLPATRAVKTLLPIAHALATAHAKKIVHRDLKPDNVFLIRSDDLIQPKLVDFGIAKLERADARITRMGTALGSPGYMSPEQARGDDVDHRSDIWAFCVMLYETLTGQLPFEADSYNALLRAIIEDDPPSIRELAAGDDALWAILVRGLEKDPDRRWSTMRGLGQALAQWLLDQGLTEDIAGGSLQATWITRSTPSAPPPPVSQTSERPLTQSLPAASTPAAPMQRAKPRGLLVIGGAIAGLAVVAIVAVVVVLRTSAPAAVEAAATSAAAVPPPSAEPTASVKARPAESAAIAPSASSPAPEVSAAPPKAPSVPAAAKEPAARPTPRPPATRTPAQKPAPEKKETPAGDKPKPDPFELKSPF